MRYPKLPVRVRWREEISRFGGLNRNEDLQAGEWEDMENLSSHRYPLLSPRQPRAVAAGTVSPQGLMAKDRLCYVDGADFVLGGERIAMELSVRPEDCPKTLVSMGSWVIILPDKKYINTAFPQDFGSIEAESTASQAAFSLCREDGVGYEGVLTQASPPENPENGCLWLDTAGLTPGLKEYSATQGQWASILTTYVKISAPGIGSGFSPYDGVRLSGCREPGLNGSRCLWAVGQDYVVLQGLITAPFTQEEPVTLRRVMPELDLCFEAENRLWGCRFGSDREGNPVNEIYASKLGDFKNWESFLGLAGDSYRASCGAEGPFTGGIHFLGYPTFFREGCLHRVYGSAPASYRIQTVPCRGVQQGCGGSLAQVGQRLIYRSRGGYCAYDGSVPADISRALGRKEVLSAQGGSLGEKYYVSQENLDGSWELLVWDGVRGLWHREDSLQAHSFCTLEGRLYALDRNSRNILTLVGGEGEAVSWMARTGPLTAGTPDRGYLSGLHLRLQLPPGSYLTCEVQYDGEGDWLELGTVFGASLATVLLPLVPRRCDSLRLRLRGVGDMKLYSIIKTMEKGSDLG